MQQMRRVFWPRSITDIGSTGFFSIAIPCVFYFELFTVLPAVVGAHTLAHYLHAIIGTFILQNIVTNQLALMLVDPSIRGRQLNAPPPPPPPSADDGDDDDRLQESWHLCAVCEALVPPRTWHCTTCGICVLKRDHHCAFSGCCVGHHNQRYFCWLLAYTCVGTAYASWFNVQFVFGVHAALFWNPLTAVKMMFPFAVVLVDTTWEQTWLMAFMVCTLGAAFTGFLCGYHGQNVWLGNVVHDRNESAAGGRRRRWDLGGWTNVEMVLGRRWRWTWVSAFVRSDLPTEGVHWEWVAAKARELRLKNE